MKILIISLILLTSCGKVEGIKLKKKVPAEIIQNLNTCVDFNASNYNEELPCSCDSQYFLSLDTKECVDKKTFPKINITIENNASLLKDDYQTAAVSIDADQVDPTYTTTFSTKIKGRGNSTWEFPKKSFRLKLDSSKPLLGLPKHKDWVFLANYSDKTLLRVMLANEMGRRLKMDYSPRYRVVEVTLNNKYRGVYLMTEQIKIAKDRVDISDSDITGGYILELDRYRDGDYLIESPSGLPFVMKEPDPPSPEQLNYITEYIRHFEEVLFSNNFNNQQSGYASLIDTDSFIEWYLINEILKNSDAANFSSVYYHKSAGEKLKMGPIWDFDTSGGNNNYTNAEFPEGWWIRTHGVWFNRLFDDPVFNQKVKEKYSELYKFGLDKTSLLKFIDQKASALEFAQKRNFDKWGTMGIYVWPNPVIFGTYSEEVDYLKQWLTLRIDWMTKELK